MKVGELIKYLEQYNKDTEVLCRRSHASLDIYTVRGEGDGKTNSKVYIECDWDVYKNDKFSRTRMPLC